MGDTLHAARVSQRVSQAELAERAGNSRALVARIERRNPGCAVGSVFEIAAILRVPLFDLDERTIRREALHTTHLRTLLPGSVRRRRTVLMTISDFDDGAAAITSVGERLFAIYRFIGHIWPMLHTSGELAASLGQQIKQRRLGIGLTQTDAAGRAGVSYRTWRRLEAEGKASIDDLVRAAVALRCEQDLASLFPEPPATSMDALLQQQKAARAAVPKRRLRASSSKAAS